MEDFPDEKALEFLNLFNMQGRFTKEHAALFLRLIRQKDCSHFLFNLFKWPIFKMCFFEKMPYGKLKLGGCFCHDVLCLTGQCFTKFLLPGALFFAP